MSKTNKTILITLLAVFAISGGFFGAKALADKSAKQDQEQDQSQPVETSVENPQTPTSSKEIKPDTETSDNKTPIQYDGANPNDSDSLTGYFSVVRLENDKLTLRVNIDQYLTSGVCTLVVTDAAGNRLVENSAKILPDASTSTCAGFDLTDPSFATSPKPFSLTLTLTPVFAADGSNPYDSGTLETTLE